LIHTYQKPTETVANNLKQTTKTITLNPRMAHTEKKMLLEEASNLKMRLRIVPAINPANLNILK
jgi:hypothetical protein